jgi:hypothetical protein
MSAAASRGPERNLLSMGPERNPAPAGAQIGPDGNLGTGCSGTAAKDSELSNPDEAAAAADDAVESSGSRRSTDVESGVETLALSAAPEMARNVVASSAAAAEAALASATRSSAEKGTRTLSGRT